MKLKNLSRRDFLKGTTALAGSALASPFAAFAAKPTATDQVTLGGTGIKLSRLGIGTGSNSGRIQHALGQDGFTRLVHYAYDQGITYIDAAKSYRTHGWIGQAIKGLPREKLFIQSKIGGRPENALQMIDEFRKVYDTDYIDSVLVHYAYTRNWTDERKRVMDAIAAAQDKQWVKIRGVSCHSLPALEQAAATDWNQVHLVRINPQGAHIDTPKEEGQAKSDRSHLPAVEKQVRAMRAKGRGIIGMKLIGNGDFTDPDQREESIRYVMQSGLCDAVVIGVKSAAEIDEAIQRINRALAEA
jgi:predicted aldo/keto reductase-like oxidoreductase